MEENVKTPFWKPALIYGLILAFVSIILSLAFYFTGLYLKGWVSFLSLVIGIVVLVYILLLYRKEYLGGLASYAQIFWMAFAAGMISSVIGLLFSYVMQTVIAPDMMENIRLAAEEKIMNNPRIPESMYDTLFERIEKNMQPVRQMVQGLIISVFINALIALIVAAFLKKEETPADAV